MNLQVPLVRAKQQSANQIKQFISVLNSGWCKVMDTKSPGYFEVHDGSVPLFTVTIVPQRRTSSLFRAERIGHDEARLVFAEIVEGGLPSKCLEEIEQSIYSLSFQRVRYYQRASGSATILFIETPKFTIYLMQPIERVELRR